MLKTSYWTSKSSEMAESVTLHISDLMDQKSFTIFNFVKDHSSQLVMNQIPLVSMCKSKTNRSHCFASARPVSER
jgi:hypothetical protein